MTQSAVHFEQQLCQLRTIDCHRSASLRELFGFPVLQILLLVFGCVLQVSKAAPAGPSGWDGRGWGHAKWQIPMSCQGNASMDTRRADRAIAWEKPKLISVSFTQIVIQAEEGEQGRHARVIGGQVSTRGEWPWLAALGLRSEGQECGGSLVAPDWILTAAHCIQQRSSNPCDYNMRLGEHHLRDPDEDHIDIIPDRIVMHPKYTQRNYMNDIALLHLSTPAPLETHHEIGIIGLASDETLAQVTDVGHCQVAGWGRYDVNSLRTSQVVRHVPTPILTRSACFKIFGFLPRGQFCAGRLQGGQDSCQGDSGGPLVCKVQDRKLQFGIVSWGHGCAEVLKTGVYSSLPHYHKWIESIIN